MFEERSFAYIDVVFHRGLIFDLETTRCFLDDIVLVLAYKFVKVYIEEGDAVITDSMSKR